jgi:nicotinic acid phosphoribosyltransferase
VLTDTFKCVSFKLTTILPAGKINDVATFDLFFRKNPFKGEFTIFAGLWDCMALLENFHYSDSDIAYLRTVLPPSVEDEFYTFLQAITPQEVKVYALPEGKGRALYSFPPAKVKVFYALLEGKLVLEGKGHFLNVKVKAYALLDGESKSTT